MNPATRFLRNLQQKWNQFSARQKRNLTISVVSLGVAFTAVMWLVTRPNYVTIMSGLDNQSLGQIQTQLQSLKIPNELQGSSILVPKSQADTARVQLAMAGLPKSGQVDYSSIPNSYSMTQEQFNLQVLNVLQNSLEQTIDSMDQVVSSRVNIVMPSQNNIFVDQSSTPAQASVFVQVANGSQLTSDEVAGIQSLVAHSVPGLTTANVTVVDQQGVTLSTGGLDTASGVSSYSELSARQQIESDLQSKLTQGLQQIVGYGNVVVTVSADVSFNQVKSQTHTVSPVTGLKTGLPTSQQQVHSNANSVGGASGGLVGQSSSNPGLNTYPGLTSGAGNSTNAQTENTVNYDNNYTNSTIVQDPIQISGYSVGIFVNSTKTSASSQFQKQIQSFVNGSIGTQPGLKNSVSVSFVPFHATPFGIPSQGLQIPNSALLGAAGVGLLALVGGGILIWRRRRSRSEAEQLLRTMTTTQVAEASPRLTESEQLRKQLEKLANDHPAQFVNILRNWLTEE